MSVPHPGHVFPFRRQWPKVISPLQLRHWRMLRLRKKRNQIHKEAPPTRTIMTISGTKTSGAAIIKKRRSAATPMASLLRVVNTRHVTTSLASRFPPSPPRPDPSDIALTPFLMGGRTAGASRRVRRRRNGAAPPARSGQLTTVALFRRFLLDLAGIQDGRGPDGDDLAAGSSGPCRGRREARRRTERSAFPSGHSAPGRFGRPSRVSSPPSPCSGSSSSRLPRRREWLRCGR